MTLLLASAPILLILVLMIGWRWSAARAGAAGYLCGLILAVWRFGATPRLLAYAHMKALLFSIDVLLIIWAAFLLYRVSDEAGAVEIIGKALYRLTPDRSLQAMLLGWVFASFLQGVGGLWCAGGRHRATVGGLGAASPAGSNHPFARSWLGSHLRLDGFLLPSPYRSQRSTRGAFGGPFRFAARAFLPTEWYVHRPCAGRLA